MPVFIRVMKKKIAILAQFPIWMADNSFHAPNRHFEVWLVSLFQALPELCQEYEFHWISFDKSVKKTRRFESHKQFIHILPGRSLRIGQLLHYVRERYLISKELKLIQPDLLHAWGTETFYALAGKSFRGRKILSMQGILTAYAERAPMASFMLKQSKFEKKTMPEYPYITAESPWAVDRCKELAPKSTVIQWEYSANEGFFHIERNLSKTPTCLIAGTSTPVKDVETAIKAFSMPELSHIRLYMAGVNADQYPNLPSNIIPLGRVTRERIMELLSTVWCLVHPSLADCCPNIVKESRIIGVPCIVTHECGAKQYVINGKSGYVIPIKSPHILAERVLDITKDEQTSLSMGNYDRERCREAISADTMIRELLKIYEMTLSAP